MNNPIEYLKQLNPKVANPHISFWADGLISVRADNLEFTTFSSWEALKAEFPETEIKTIDEIKANKIAELQKHIDRLKE